MAEVGVAASMGNVDPDDGWKTHFLDTIGAASSSYNWQMVELHQGGLTGSTSSSSGARSSPDGRRARSPGPFGGHAYRRPATLATGRA